MSLLPSEDRPTPVPLADVSVDDEFWNGRLATNRETTIEHQYDRLGERCLPNFRRVRDGETGGFRGMCFEDSDAYKWLEAASYVLANRDDPDLKERVDELVDLIAAAQDENGYLNTYHQLEFDEERWTNVRNLHELYCAGHLIEAAVAHYRATGERSLLTVATEFADHVDRVFGTGEGELDAAPGHEEIELALVKLHRATDEERYLELARYFVDARGTTGRFEWETDHAEELPGDEEWHTGSEYDPTYYQTHAPVRAQETVEGHAVRAMYLFCGAADVAGETDDEGLLDALVGLWRNMTERRTYVTGGIGSTADGERFTEDYDLPNRTAYAETCAAVGSVFWNRRLFRLTGEGRFYDVLERALYNGALAGTSLDGTAFFYENPLESLGHHHRKGWFACACCPPNLARLLASLGEYVYATTDGGVYVNLYVGSETEVTVAGETVSVTQRTDYPWEGSVDLEIGVDSPVEAALHLRVPEWCADARLSVNGERVEGEADDGYRTLDRTWHDGDSVELSLNLPVRRMMAHPDLPDDAGRLALQRGPLVYCVEETDVDVPPSRLRMDSEDSLDARWDEDLLDGVVALEGETRVAGTEGWDGRLYREWEEHREEKRVTAVPYYGWDNREEGRMAVWLPTR
ncbi:glycoside hydrolase family 127 protein [Halogeometricum luteum]|uniref:Glycoside hydrolase family 127 protein n=1 Tax=Halogeometricum luteum TaxID=2950537 RepID=A0ABU2G4R3_9EURY|nr:beta-L-arabinofuranosidase domain-containing protein [Halogeometricum sp. S3BR5-2]MDS0295787.1 glycoside hydrolase family 127 protein [Halogeometricum sp. S3BR5-2]